MRQSVSLRSLDICFVDFIRLHTKYERIDTCRLYSVVDWKNYHSEEIIWVDVLTHVRCARINVNRCVHKMRLQISERKIQNGFSSNK